MTRSPRRTGGEDEATSDRPRALVVIPARGGSKGIPRKNLRALAGRPLIAWTIETALRSRHPLDVVVSSDDTEILAIAAKLGARTHRRDAALAGDATTLDETIVAAVPEIQAEHGHSYDVVVTVQPTSPLLTEATLDEAIDRLRRDPSIDTVLTVTDDTHLTWSIRDGSFVPNYTARVNRQALPRTYRETGGLIACQARVLDSGSRIGASVAPIEVSGGEAIDIDTPDHWALAEWYRSQRDLLFVVAGSPELGLGHVSNALTIANELPTSRVRFLATAGSELARDAIAAAHYEVHLQQTDDLVAEIAGLAPDVVLNDRLDTTADEMERLRDAGFTTINFEDLGPGAALADVVINAIYPETEARPGHYFGPAYFCVRAEFALTEPRPVADEVRRVLLTFGGTDPGNLTRKVLSAIHGECAARGIEIGVVAGRGYRAFATLEPFAGVRVDRAVADMADRMRDADVAFTSAGRTTFEVASVGTPTIVLAQNARELTHLFASEAQGFVNLGLGEDVPESRILAAFVALVDDPARRRRMQARMLENPLRAGTARVVELIQRTVERHVTR